MAFLLSTPQTGVDSIMVTYALLGPVLAVFRPLAAFLTGIIGGLAANFLHNNNAEEEEKEAADDKPCCCAAAPKRGPLQRAFTHGFITLPGDVGKSMLAGVAIAAAISTFIPEDLLAAHLGGGILSLLAMMLFGIPVYVCATASVPIAAALIAKGVSPGAALVFLMTGPATNAAGIAAVWKTMGSRTAVVYLATTALTALAAGLVLDRFLIVSGAALECAHGPALPPWLQTGLALALLVVLAAPSLRRVRETLDRLPGSRESENQHSSAPPSNKDIES